MCPIEDRLRKPANVHVVLVIHPVVRIVFHQLLSYINQECRMSMNQAREAHVFVEWMQMFDLREENSGLSRVLQDLQIS